MAASELLNGQRPANGRTIAFDFAKPTGLRRRNNILPYGGVLNEAHNTVHYTSARSRTVLGANNERQLTPPSLRYRLIRNDDVKENCGTLRTGDR